jgi:hypothetical protein
MGIRKLLLVSCLLGLASGAMAQDPPPADGGGDMLPPPPPPDGEMPVGHCITPVGPCDGEDGSVCGEGGACHGGICVLEGAECKGPDDCDERSACYAVANPCETQDQCMGPFVCQANVCVAILLGPPPDGMMCAPDDRICQMGGAPIECMDASQCMGGDCVEGLCTFRDGSDCTDEMKCPTVGADGMVTDADGDGVPDDKDQSDDSSGDQEQDVRDQIQDQKDMQMQPLACSASTGSSRVAGLGLLLALSTLITRRRR